MLKRHRKLSLERLESRRLLAVFIVDTFTDSATGVCGVGGTGNVGCTLRSAIIASNARAGADTINLSPGTYTLSLANLGPLTNPATGDLDISDDLTIVGSVANPASTVIDAAQIDRVFNVVPASTSPITAIFNGLTIQNGLESNEGLGGGINASSSTTLEVRNTIIRANRKEISGGGGGGIATAGNLLLNNAIISNNFAALGQGGGIAMFEAGTLQITDSVIDANEANGQGGGIWLGGGFNYQTTITQSSIANNTATFGDGGGLYVDGGGTNAAVTLDQVNFQSNVAGGSGAGAYIYNVSSLSQIDGSYDQNRAGEAGGGLYLLNDKSATVEGTAFTSNTSVSGGGGAAVLTDATFTNTLFRQNRATGDNSAGSFNFDQGGGAIAIAQDLGVRPTVRIVDSSILNNSAALGGGIGAANANVAIVNTTIDGNQATGTFAGAGGVGFAQDNVGGVAANRVRLTIDKSTISNNTSAAQAGGIGVADANATITDTTVTGNKATAGRAGGIGIIGLNNSPSLTTDRVTIDNNTSSSDGGGFAAQDAGFFFNNTTISNNTAGGNGGGIAYANSNAAVSGDIHFSTVASNRVTGFGSNVAVNGGITHLLSSIVADPLGSAPVFNFVSGGPGELLSQGFNLFSDTSVSGTTTGDQVNTNPLLNPLANNGGMIRTRGLQNNSPAIDKGSTAVLAVDARGLSRPFDGDGNGVAVNDIGAVEHRQSSIIVTANNSSLNFNEDGVAQSLNLGTLTTVTPPNPATYSITTQPARGTLTLVGSTATYKPAADDFTTTALSFIYKATVGTVSDTGTVSISIASVNDPPIFVADIPVAAVRGVATTITGLTLLANDKPGPANETGTVMISAVTGASAQSGTVTLNGQKIIYTSAAGFSGRDTISYTISDGAPANSTTLGTLSVNVLAPSVTVNTRNSSLSFTEDGAAKSLNLSSLTTVTGSALAPVFTIFTPPTRGTVTITGTTVTYRPAANDFTPPSLSFVYRATIATVGLLSDTGTVSISIASVNDPPVAANDNVVLPSQAAFAIPQILLLNNDVAGPANELTQSILITAVTQPGAGTVVRNSSDITYTPPAGFSGTTSFTYTVTDDEGLSDIAVVNITVPPTTSSADLSGRVTCDTNGNGNVDLGEEKPGVTVFIDGNGNRILDSGERSATTDSAGVYQFTGLAISAGQKAIVVVKNPPSCLPVAPEFGVTRTAINTGNLSRAIAATDFDRDGDTDLLVVNELGNDVSVLLNNANTGSFTAGSSIQLGQRSVGIAAWQASSSSAPVVAVASVGTTGNKGSIHVIENGRLSRELTAGDGPVAVAVNDFNGDGQADFVAAAIRSGTIVGRMSGESKERVLATARNPKSITAAKINNDTFVDLVVVAFGFEGDNTSEMIVLLGDGKGNFTPQKQTISGRGSADVAVSNFDSDAPDEIAIAGYDGTIRIYDFANGKLSPLTSLSTQVGVEAIAAQDVNQDGLTDLVVANSKAETIDLFINSPTGFIHNRTITGVPSPSDIVIAKLDNDNILDLAVTNLYGQTSPSFKLPSSVTILGLNVSERELTFTSNPVTANFAFVPFPSAVLKSLAEAERVYDVDRNGTVSASDALVVLNSMSKRKRGEGENSSQSQIGKLDVNSDGKVSVLDALLVLNQMSKQQRAKKSAGELLANPIQVANERRVRAVDTLMSDVGVMF